MSQRVRIFTAIILAIVLGCTSDVTGPVSPSLSIVPGGGQNQSGTVGMTLPLPLIVQVGGVSGAVNGQFLNFVVTSGGGSVFANVVLTGTPSSGPAAKMSAIGQNTWTLGPTTGSQTVEARLVDSKTGATLTQAIFRATAIAGSASNLEMSMGNNQRAPSPARPSASHLRFRLPIKREILYPESRSHSMSLPAAARL